MCLYVGNIVYYMNFDPSFTQNNVQRQWLDECLYKKLPHSSTRRCRCRSSSQLITRCAQINNVLARYYYANTRKQHNHNMLVVEWMPSNNSVALKRKCRTRHNEVEVENEVFGAD
jgi:hypothetical protein